MLTKSTSPTSIVSTIRSDAEAGNRTQASLLAEMIRKDIILGVFPPQSKLKIRELAERYEVGTVPLREALSRLVQSGFVEAEDQRGFRVADASAEELLDISRVRQEIESTALRAAIQHGDLDWETRVLAAFHRLDRTPMTDSASKMLNPAWEVAHDEYHAALIAGCGSDWLVKICTLLREQADRYRQMSVVAEKHSKRNVGSEHKDLTDAILARDADRACTLLQKHFAATTELALAQLGQHRS